MTQHAFGRRPAAVVDPKFRAEPEISRRRNPAKAKHGHRARNTIVIVSGAAVTLVLTAFLALGGANAAIPDIRQIVLSAF
jgi:hypothetical protein